MFYWLFALLFIEIGIPILAFIAIVVFASLRMFHVINCSWWWIAIPVVIMIAGLIFDFKTEYSTPK